MGFTNEEECKTQERKSMMDLHNDLVEFINQLIMVLPDETALVFAKIYLSTKIDKEKLIKKFSKKIVPVSELIRKRNEDFFLSGSYIDSILGDYGLKFDFRPIWGKLNTDNKQQIWSWFDCFLKTAETYMQCEKFLKLCRTRSLFNK